MDLDLAGFTSDGSVTPFDDLIAHGAQIISRKYTLTSGQGEIARGTVVGVVTSGGKLKKSASAAGDGSEVPFGIVATNADATSSDVDVLVYTRGSFNENALILGTGHTIASIRETLRDKGIYLETPVKRAP